MKREGIWGRCLIVILLVVLFAYFALGQHRFLPASFSTNQSLNSFYNITINNTDTGATTNITDFNVTLPSGFSFVALSNGSGVSGASFSTVGNVLIWNKSTTLGALLLNGQNQSFWFNATAPATVGNYGLDLTTYNATGLVTNSTNITITVNDITPPFNCTFVAPTPSSGSNLSYNSTAVNVSASDDSTGLGLSVIRIYLYNTTGLVNNTNTSVSGMTNNAYLNFTNLVDGIYYINATVNDTSGNQNLTGTGTITITVDTVKPATVVYGGSSDNGGYANRKNVLVNVTATDVTSGIMNITIRVYNSTSSLINSSAINSAQLANISVSGSNDGIYYINATAYDYAGNYNDSISTRNITLDTAAPIINITSPSGTQSSSNVSINFTASDALSGVDSKWFNNGTANVTYTSATSIVLADESYTFVFYANDTVGNLNITSVSFSVSTASSSSTTGGSGGGGGAASFWSNVLITNSQFDSGYTQALSALHRIQVSVNNETHYVGINQINSGNVVINVTSNEQDVTLSPGQSHEFEVSGDNYYDIKVTLNNIVNTNSANITVIHVHDPIPSSQTNQNQQTNNNATGQGNAAGAGNANAASKSLLNNTTAIIIVVVLVLIVIGVIVYLKSKKRQSR